MRGKGLRAIRTVAIYILLALLLWWALRNVPLIDIWESLKQLRGWQIIILLVINAVVITLMAARWWIIVRADNRRVPFLPLIGYRLSVFGISYFTPGPQVGGEPLQIIYLQKNYGLTYARATAAVIMDKLLEFLVNFLLLAVGAWAVFRVGLIPDNGGQPNLSLIGLAGLLLWPLVHILLLYNRRFPISAIMRWQPFIPQRTNFVRLVIVSERMAASFCRRHLRAMLEAIAVSILSVGGIVAEYVLMVEFLGMQLSAIQVFAALTALQLAFLMPLPGGLGALEASQVFALGVFGQPASAAISLVLLQRGRDILNGGLGLLLAGRGFQRVRQQVAPSSKAYLLVRRINMNLSVKHFGIILSSLATALLHITLFPDIVFTLNGVGYLGLLGAYLLPIPFFQERHRLVWWGLAGYTLLTIILWVVMGDKQFVAGTSSAIGYYAKAAEVVLLTFLWADRPQAVATS